MNTFTRTVRIAPKIADNRRLSFYASVFNSEAPITERNASGELVSYREIIRPKAFADSLATDAEVIANIDHDASQTFAKRSTGELLLQEDAHGLFCSCYLAPGEFGDSIIARVERGELDGCSFRFGAVEDRVAGDVVERLRVTLADVCLTHYPAYETTRGEVHLRNKSRHRATGTKLRLLKLRSKTLHNRNLGGA